MKQRPAAQLISVWLITLFALFTIGIFSIMYVLGGGADDPRAHLIPPALVAGFVVTVGLLFGRIWALAAITICLVACNVIFVVLSFPNLQTAASVVTFILPLDLIVLYLWRYRRASFS